MPLSLKSGARSYTQPERLNDSSRGHSEAPPTDTEIPLIHSTPKGSHTCASASDPDGLLDPFRVGMVWGCILTNRGRRPGAPGLALVVLHKSLSTIYATRAVILRPQRGSDMAVLRHEGVGKEEEKVTYF